MAPADLFRAARSSSRPACCSLYQSRCSLSAACFDSDYASFDLVWSFLPAIAIVLVPAFGARAFAQEDGSRELELLLTLPLSDTGIVIGKWLSGTAFLALTLCCAAPIAITIGYLGAPDWGAAAAGAVGAVVMLATLYAVAMFCSAVTGEQTSAYVLAVVALMALTAMGWDAVAQLMPLPASVIDTLRLLSPKLNLDRLAAGQIELVALSSFALEIALALGGCVLALKARRHAITFSRDLAGEWGKGALVAAAGVFLIAGLSRAEIYLDATSGKLFTLDRATLDIARAAPPGTTLNFYWTESDASVPAYIRAHATRVRQVLTTIARRSDGRVKLQIFNTKPDSDAEWRAVAAGYRRVPLGAGGGFFLGVEVAHGEKRQVFPYLDENRGGQFEYDIALALSRIEQSHVPKVGLLSPLIAPSDMTDAVSKFSFIDALKTAADVAAIPFFAKSCAYTLDVLVIVGSAPLKREMLYAIDQHLIVGKELVVLLDPFDSLQHVQQGRFILLNRRPQYDRRSTRTLWHRIRRRGRWRHGVGGSSDVRNAGEAGISVLAQGGARSGRRRISPAHEPQRSPVRGTGEPAAEQWGPGADFDDAVTPVHSPLYCGIFQRCDCRDGGEVETGWREQGCSRRRTRPPCKALSRRV